MTSVAIGVACAGGTASLAGAMAPPASAFNPLKPLCDAAGLISGVAGKACSAVQHGGHLLSAGRKLLSGNLGGAISSAFGGGGSVAGGASAAVGLAALVTWVVGGARYALRATAGVIDRTTTPQLRTTWFSSTYWRVAAIAAVLTLPFLFAAAIQALVHSDLILLLRAVGCLPPAMLGVGIAAPLTTLLLAASDQLSMIVSAAAGNASGSFLRASATTIGGLALISASPFLVFFAGLLTVAGAFVLWLELLLREAAVYVIVLMLPLAFAALVWPARRIWAVRAVELLVALILSKFAIVAVLSLGGAALDHAGAHGISGLLAGFVLLIMGAFAPWALLRLLPLTELASGAAGSLRGDAGVLQRWAEAVDAGARRAHDLTAGAPAPGSQASGAADGTDGAEAVAAGLASLARPAADGSYPLAGAPRPGPVPEAQASLAQATFRVSNTHADGGAAARSQAGSVVPSASAVSGAADLPGAGTGTADAGPGDTGTADTGPAGADPAGAGPAGVDPAEAGPVDATSAGSASEGAAAGASSAQAPIADPAVEASGPGGLLAGLASEHQPELAAAEDPSHVRHPDDFDPPLDLTDLRVAPSPHAGRRPPATPREPEQQP